MENINVKRIRTALIIFVFLMFLLGTRAWYIQIFCHDELEAAAVSQYQMAIVGLDTRGNIFDRNLKPLTGGTKEYYYIINRENNDQNLENIMESVESQQLAKSSSAYLVYRTESYNSRVNRILKDEYGAYVFENQSRYADNQMACHLLGYLNEDEQKGVSGIELMYQQQLAASNSSLNLWADAAGKILKGVAPSVIISTDNDTMKTNSLVTTIDRRLQYVCENAIQSAGESGAALIMDAETGEIMAWASSPTFNPNDIESYLNDDGDCLVDKVCQGTYAPGSVFKIVTAAAALESGICNEKTQFECLGQVTVEGVVVNCSTGGEIGHGVIDMAQAMAQSCNCYFSQLGQAVGCDKIVKMAKKMGLGEKCFDNFPGEKEGNIPDGEQVGPWDTTNISIGQGEILVTPLQMARVTCIIASGGVMTEPELILGNAGNARTQIISPKTASLIDEMLQEVMTSGTGKGQWPLEVRGKTGTAEAVSSGENVNNCWFSGYFSVKDKTYVVTVLVEDGQSGASTAMPVFKDVCNFLADSL